MVIAGGNFKRATVKQFVFEEYDWVFATDCGFEQTLGIGGIIGCNDNQTGYAGIPWPPDI